MGIGESILSGLALTAFLAFIGYITWKSEAGCDLGNHDWSAWTDPQRDGKGTEHEGVLKQTKCCTVCNRVKTRRFN